LNKKSSTRTGRDLTETLPIVIRLSRPNLYIKNEVYVQSMLILIAKRASTAARSSLA